MRNYLVFTNLDEFNGTKNPISMPIGSSCVFPTQEPKKALEYVRDIQATTTETKTVFILELEPERESTVEGFSPKEDDFKNIVYIGWQNSFQKGDWTERFPNSYFRELVSE